MLCVDEELVAGERYQLPTLRVRNPGTIATDYRMIVQPIAGSGAPDPDWVSFSPVTFSLDPYERQPVEVTLDLPAVVTGGDYEVLISAQIVADGEGARVGAAAASRLAFTVAQAEVAEASGPMPQPGDPDAGRVSLLWLLPLLLLLLWYALSRFRPRYSFRFERRT